MSAGTWVDLGEDFGGIGIRTRAFSNAYLDARQAKLRRAGLDGDAGDNIPQAESRRILARLLIEHCLLDVRNLQDDNGEPVPFDSFRELLLDDGYPELYVACVAAATRVTADREADLSDAKEKLAEALRAMLEWSPAISMKRKMIAAAATDEDLACAEAINVGDGHDVPDSLRWIWRAYTRLGETRGWVGGGMGAPVPLPIAFSDVLQWCRHHRHDEEMTYMLESCIRELDRVYLDHMAAKQKT